MTIEIPQELLDRAARWADLKRWERRELGQELRRLGLAYREIREIIPIARGTVSAWCRDIPLTAEQIERLRSLSGNSEVGRAKTGTILRARSLERIENIKAAARKEARELLDDPFWISGVIAYWAEGSKRNKNLHFANSDPVFIILFLKWARKYLGVPLEKFVISLHLHAGQDEDERKQFWSVVTGLSLSQFRKTFIKAEGTGHRKNILYNGTASIRIYNTELLHRVLAWIDVVRDLYSEFVTLPMGR